MRKGLAAVVVANTAVAVILAASGLLAGASASASALAPAASASAASAPANDLDVDLGAPTGAFDGGASGSLYGIYDKGVPSDNLIQGMGLVTTDTKAQDGQQHLSLIHISEPTRLGMISYAVFCLKK